MITLIQYLTRPKLPKEYDGQIYKHLWHCAMIEGIFIHFVRIDVLMHHNVV